MSLVSTNPATLEVLGQVETTAPEAVPALVAAARAAWTDWAARSFCDHGRYLLRARDYLLAHLDSLAVTISQENGKPLVEAVTAELYPMADLLYYYGTQTQRLLRPHRIGTGIMQWLGRWSRIHYQPLGVVGIISPWNYPFAIPAGTVAMALVTGNCVILKPSELTPLVARGVAAMFAAAGLPPAVFQLAQGDGRTGAALCQAGLDKICFTGSVSVGRQIMASCAPTLTPCQLELGGKDPMIVRADADLDHASSGAVWGAFTNAGQVCAAVERVYVQAAVVEEFTRLVVAKTQRLRQGIGTNPEIDIGPLNNAEQLAIVEAQLADARARGAQILTGGQRLPDSPGYFYEPTVLTGVDHRCAIMREETFGPVLPIMGVADDAEAIRLANDSPYGLTASIWSRDRRAAQRMALQLRAGTVTINDCVYTHAICQTPWGGRAQSGFGRTHGVEGLRELVEIRHVHVNAAARWKSLWWFPYGQRLYDIFRTLTRTVTGGWGQRLLHLRTLVKALRLPKS